MSIEDTCRNLAKQVRNDTLDHVLKQINPGKQPCGCIRKRDGFWMHECDCNNSGDLSSAAEWCSERSIYDRIASLKDA